MLNSVLSKHFSSYSNMVEGQCLCGGCKVIVNAEPMNNGLGVCHCKDCRQCSGTAYAAVALVPSDKVRVEGSVKVYTFKNSRTGNTVSRWFCEGCGSHLLSQSEAYPERYAVRAGNIEEFTKLPILREIFTKDRWPSIPPIPGAQQVETI